MSLCPESQEWLDESEDEDEEEEEEANGAGGDEEEEESEEDEEGKASLLLRTLHVWSVGGNHERTLVAF